MNAKGKSLNQQQELFCLEYIKCLNGTQSAIRSGYSEKTARQIANKLMQKPLIKARIEELMKDRKEKLTIEAEFVLKNLVAVVERSMQVEVVEVWDNSTKSYVATGEYKYDSTGVNRALELIGKHIGMFDPKHSLAQEQAKRHVEQMERQMEKTIAETEFIRERTRLLKGVTKDTGLMQSLIDVMSGGNGSGKNKLN